MTTHNQQGLQIAREALGATETSGDPTAVAEAKQAVSNESSKVQENVARAQTLLAAGADVNKQTTFSLESPTFFAVMWGFKEIAELLLEHNAVLNIRDDEGRTATDGHSQVEALLRAAMSAACVQRYYILQK